jgi:hypothetical protein
MDILAHGLWAAIGMAWWRRRRPISRRTALTTVALAVVPDIVHLLPIVGAALFEPGGFALLSAYVRALPGFEPDLPPAVAFLTGHLHCVFHSAVIAMAITLLVYWKTKALWVPLLGWWSHIVIDVFTHSAEFYPAPVLYPFTLRGFDGVAWNTPWFLALTYAAIAITLAGLWITRSPRQP